MKIKAIVLYNNVDCSTGKQMRGVYLLNEQDHRAAFGEGKDDEWRMLIVELLTQWYSPIINTQQEKSDGALDYAISIDMPDIKHFWIDPKVAIRLTEPVHILNHNAWYNLCWRFEVDKNHFTSSIHVAGYHTASYIISKPAMICPECLNEDSFLLYGKPLVAFNISMANGQQELKSPEILETIDEIDIVKVVCGNCEYAADSNSFAIST